MKFRGILSREAANILMQLSEQLKAKGVTLDLKTIDTMESLIVLARAFNDPEINDLTNYLQIECQLKAMDLGGAPLENQTAANATQPATKKKKTKTIIYRGRKMEVEI